MGLYLTHLLLASGIRCSLAGGGGQSFVIIIVVVEVGGRRNTGGKEIDAAAGLVDALQLPYVDAEVVHDGIGTLQDQGGRCFLTC